MPTKDYIEYKNREFCNDVRCLIQMKLNSLKEGSDEYERIRAVCRNSCRFTAHQFHHWLMDKGYVILRSR